MKQLHHLLQRYYRKSGNKIIFSNENTLNQLALAMMEDLGFEGMDSSILSRVINGKRLFTQRQLNSFCNVLNLPIIDKLELEQCLLSEKIHKFDSNLSPTFSKSGKDTSNYFLIVKLLRNRGFPSETIEMANFFQKKILSTDLNQKNLTILGNINNEKSRAFGEISSPERVMSDMFKSNKIGKFIGEKYNNRAMKSMTYMNIGGGLYVAKQYNSSIDFLEHHFRFVDLHNKLEFLRTLMLSYSYVNDFNGFHKSRNKALKLIEKHSLEKLDIFASIQDSIARSLMIFGEFNDSLRILDESQQISTTSFFRSQLMRTRIITLLQVKALGLSVDRSEFQHYYDLIKGKEFISFKRHQKIVSNAAKKFEILTSR